MIFFCHLYNMIFKKVKWLVAFVSVRIMITCQLKLVWWKQSIYKNEIVLKLWMCWVGWLTEWFFLFALCLSFFLLTTKIYLPLYRVENMRENVFRPIENYRHSIIAVIKLIFYWGFIYKERERKNWELVKTTVVAKLPPYWLVL